MANVAEEGETAEQMLHDITKNTGDLLAVMAGVKFTNESLSKFIASEDEDEFKPFF